MRWKEIEDNVEEHQKVPNTATSNWTNIAVANSKLVGKLNNQAGTNEIFYRYDGQNHIYIVTNQNDNTKTIGYVILQPRSGTNYVNARNASVDPAYQGKGILTNLMIWIKDNTSYKILSDTQMTTAGENLWLSLGKKNLLKVIDLATGQEEKWTGNNNIDPRKDSVDSHEYGTPSNNVVLSGGQKWFWLLEGILNYQSLMESSKYGKPVGNPTGLTSVQRYDFSEKDDN